MASRPASSPQGALDGKMGDRSAVSSAPGKRSIERRNVAPEDGCEFRGISVRKLVTYWEQLEAERIAPGVNLVTVLGEIGDGAASTGDTLVVVEDADDDMGLGLGRLPDGGMIEFEAPQVLCKPRKLWTMEDLALYVVGSPLNTKTSSLRSVLHKRKDMLADKRSLGQPFQGSYISCSSDAIFYDVVEALKAAFKSPAQRREHVFLAVFGMPRLFAQRRSVDFDPSLAFSSLREIHSAQMLFPRRLVFWGNWLEPEPFHDPWCMLELLGSASKNTKVEVLLTPKEHENFVNILTQNPADLLEALDDVDVLSNAGDQAKNILKVAERFGEARSINERLQALTRALLIASTKEVIDRIRSGESLEQSSTNLAYMYHNSGVLMSKVDQVSLALQYHHKALEWFRKAGLTDAAKEEERTLLGLLSQPKEENYATATASKKASRAAKHKHVLANTKVASKLLGSKKPTKNGLPARLKDEADVPMAHESHKVQGEDKLILLFGEWEFDLDVDIGSDEESLESDV